MINSISVLECLYLNCPLIKIVMNCGARSEGDRWGKPRINPIKVPYRPIPIEAPYPLFRDQKKILKGNCCLLSPVSMVAMGLSEPMLFKVIGVYIHIVPSYLISNFVYGVLVQFWFSRKPFKHVGCYILQNWMGTVHFYRKYPILCLNIPQCVPLLYVVVTVWDVFNKWSRGVILSFKNFFDLW